MREESCPQRIGKSHRLHPAEQVVKVQHAAVLAPLCAPRTSITAAATAWAAHAEALMTLVATMTSIPRELKTQVLFVSSRKSGRLSSSHSQKGVEVEQLLGSPPAHHTHACASAHMYRPRTHGTHQGNRPSDPQPTPWNWIKATGGKAKFIPHTKKCCVLTILGKLVTEWFKSCSM